MKLTKIHPLFLKRYIKYFYTLEGKVTEMPDTLHRHLSDGTLELIINLEAPIFQSVNNIDFIQRPRLFFGGLFHKHFFLQYTGNIHLVGAIFKPGYASHFINESAMQFRSSSHLANEVFGNSTADLFEKFKQATTATEKINELETFLLKRLNKVSTSYQADRVSKASEVIHECGGNINLSSLCRYVNMSERNFRRQFTELAGLSPKQYAGIIRVKTFVKMCKQTNRSYADLIYELGYCNASHFVNDFKRVAGISPLAFFDRLNPIDEEFILNS